MVNKQNWENVINWKNVIRKLMKIFYIDEVKNDNFSFNRFNGNFVTKKCPTEDEIADILAIYITKFFCEEIIYSVDILGKNITINLTKGGEKR